MQDESGTVNITVVSILIGVVLLIGSILLFSGKETATLPIRFEEFTDFQCPACSAYHPVVKKIVEEFSDNIEYIYKNYPLTTIHANAYNASLAGQAARLQNKFNEMSDKMFANQDYLTDNDLIKYAGEIGLNIEQFKTDFKSDVVKTYVDNDIKEGELRGINATPTFYINGEKVVFKEGDDPEQVLRSTLQEKIDLAISQTK